MDVSKTLAQLRAELMMVKAAIVVLEDLQGGRIPNLKPLLPGRRRGRKSMGLQERAEVSERMKRYWANRRKDIS